jgi:hypothetical protein
MVEEGGGLMGDHGSLVKVALLRVESCVDPLGRKPVRMLLVLSGGALILRVVYGMRAAHRFAAR